MQGGVTKGNNIELYRLFLAGEGGVDGEALSALVVLHGEELTRFISRIAGNKDDAEELMIDAFTQLVRNRDKIRRPEALKSYLFITGKNLALNFLKKNKHNPAIFENVETVLERAGTVDTLGAELFRQEQKRQLNMAMAKLKRSHREVLQLVYFEDKSYAGAGKVMNKTVKQIDNLLYNAKAALKKALECEGFSYEGE